MYSIPNYHTLCFCLNSYATANIEYRDLIKMFTISKHKNAAKNKYKFYYVMQH